MTMVDAAGPAEDQTPPAAAGVGVLAISGVSRTFDTRTGPAKAVELVDLRVRRGEFVSLLGPSGCGKSTLLRMLAGLETVSSGEILIEGVPVNGPQSQLGIVFQAPLLLPWRDALGNVLLQAEARRMEPRLALARARELMKSVGLDGFEHHRPNELSGGMQQRLAICRALLHDPAILFMDEPFGALDALTRDQMNIDLQELTRRGEKTILFVTHSIQEAVFLSDRVVVMSPRPGRVILDLDIDLPRPRLMRIRETSAFTQYERLIRTCFAAQGVLRERDTGGP